MNVYSRPLSHGCSWQIQSIPPLHLMNESLLTCSQVAAPSARFTGIVVFWETFHLTVPFDADYISHEIPRCRPRSFLHGETWAETRLSNHGLEGGEMGGSAVRSSNQSAARINTTHVLTAWRNRGIGEMKNSILTHLIFTKQFHSLNNTKIAQKHLRPFTFQHNPLI